MIHRLSIAILSLCALFVTEFAAAQAHSSDPEGPKRTQGIEEGSLLDVLVAAVEKAHNNTAWKRHDAASFSITLKLDDDEHALTGTFATGDQRFLLATADGKPLLGRDDDGRWHTPELDKLGDEAAHVRALEHILPGPFRFRAEDKRIASGGMREVNNRDHYAASITFAESKDWTIAFIDPRENQLAVLAYFIAVEDDDDPRYSQSYAAVSSKTKTSDDVTLTRKWAIWKWSRPHGLVGEEPIGSVRISEVKFAEADAETFSRPEPDDA